MAEITCRKLINFNQKTNKILSRGKPLDKIWFTTKLIFECVKSSRNLSKYKSQQKWNHADVV